MRQCFSKTCHGVMKREITDRKQYHLELSNRNQSPPFLRRRQGCLPSSGCTSDLRSRRVCCGRHTTYSPILSDRAVHSPGWIYCVRRNPEMHRARLADLSDYSEDRNSNGCYRSCLAAKSGSSVGGKQHRSALHGKRDAIPRAQEFVRNVQPESSRHLPSCVTVLEQSLAVTPRNNL